MIRIKYRVLSLCLAACLALAPLAAMAATPPVGALLVQDAPDREGLPKNFRTTAFPFKASQGPAPTRLGLDTLMASGSGQFSAGELRVMLMNLPARLVVVDLRQESHGFVNGMAVSWYGFRNWANRGKDLAQIRQEQAGLLAGLLGRGGIPVAIGLKKDSQGAPRSWQSMQVRPRQVMDEATLAASHGAAYLRIPCQDHVHPQPAEVERFLRLYRTLEPGVWLHFHCRAGKGRTTTFMLMLDILRNGARVDLDDLARRQFLLGGKDLLHSPPSRDSYKFEAYQARDEFIRRFYAYARQNPGDRPLVWSDWFARQNARP